MYAYLKQIELFQIMSLFILSSKLSKLDLVTYDKCLGFFLKTQLPSWCVISQRSRIRGIARHAIALGSKIKLNQYDQIAGNSSGYLQNKKL